MKKNKKDQATQVYISWMGALLTKIQSANGMILQGNAHLDKMNPSKADLKIIDKVHIQLGNAVTRLAETLADHNYGWDDPSHPWNMTEEQLKNQSLASIIHGAISKLGPDAITNQINMD